MTKKLIGFSKLTAGNIRNNHFYLTSFITLFPKDLIGGKNKTLSAPKSAIVHWGASSPEESDIDGSKKIFRARGFMREFFANTDAQVGDQVKVEEISPYEYEISLLK